jgi:putative hemolysin
MATKLNPERHIPDLYHVRGKYRVRFALNDADRDELFRLRFDVFNREMNEGLEGSWESGRDRDRFDAQCQHLMVQLAKTGETIGTYRLQVSEMAEAMEGFYSATEFDLSTLPDEVRHNSVELGRACIGKDHRNKTVLFLLWRGLASYVLWNRKRFFFGCSSLTSQDPAEGRRAWEQMQAGGYDHPDFVVHPLPGYGCEGGEDLPPGKMIKIPRLFNTYLRYGARLCGPPAVDRLFGTIDFLALLDVEAMDPRTFGLFAG